MSQNFAIQTEAGYPELVSTLPIKKGTWIGSFAQPEALRTVIGVESASAWECDGRSPWPKIYFGDDRYFWPVTAQLYYLTPSNTPNVGIMNGLDVVALANIKPDTVLTYDPATVIPHGDVAPLLDGEPRYFNSLTSDEVLACSGFIPRPLLTEFGDLLVAEPLMIVVGLDMRETEQIVASLETIVSQTGRSMAGADLSSIYPTGTLDAPRLAGSWPVRKEVLFNGWRGSPVLAVGQAAEHLGLANLAEYGWYSYRGTQIARIPDPRTCPPEEGPKISEFLRVAPGDIGFVSQSIIGRTRIRPLPSGDLFRRV